MLSLNRVSQASSLVNAKSSVTCCFRNRSHLFSMGEIKRPAYAQLYPTVLVKPNGSTLRISYHEPIALINLPFDLSTLDERERKLRIMKVGMRLYSFYLKIVVINQIFSMFIAIVKMYLK